MFAKSSIVLDGNCRLTGARTTRQYPYGHNSGPLCGSALQFNPQYDTKRSWFEYGAEDLTKSYSEQYCSYVKPGVTETCHIQQMQHYVQDARPLVFLAVWHCYDCDSDYHCERHCLTCRTGEHNHMFSDTETQPAEVVICAC